MRVAYVLLHFPYLTETFVAEEIRALRAQGVDVTIVSLLEPGKGVVQDSSRPLVEVTWYAPAVSSPRLWLDQLAELVRNPARYVATSSRLLAQPGAGVVARMKRLAIFCKAASAARRLRQDTIEHLHSHFAWLPGAGAWTISRILDVPYTVTVHAYDLFSTADLAPLVCGQAARVVAISEYNKAAVAQLAPEARTTVIHCGLDGAGLELVAGGDSEAELSGRGGRGEELHILAVGSLVPKKGHADLLRACAELKSRGVVFHCTILGGGPDEALLGGIVSEHALSDNVTFTGAVTQRHIAAAYRQGDVFALACVVAPNGDRDGIPVALMEAAWFGLPLVSTRVSGIPELVRPEETGLLVEPGDVPALADALERLANDVELRKRLGRGGRALVQEEFDVHTNARCLARIFDELLPGPNAD